MPDTFFPSSFGRVSSVKEASLDPTQGLAEYRRAGNAFVEADSMQCAEQITEPSPLFAPPILTPPSTTKKYSDLGFINLMESFHTSAEGILHSLSESIRSSSDKLKTLAHENIQKLKDAAEKAQESDFWSLLKKIGQCILGAISVIFGVTLVATGAGSVIGAVMIASGVITLANFAMTETGSWEWVAKQLTSDEEKRKNIVFWVPMAVGIIGAVLGIGGSIATALWTSLNMAQQALAIVQAALGLYEGATTIGKGVSDAKLIWSQAELIDVHHRTTLEHFKLTTSSQSAVAFMRELEDSQKHAEETIGLIAQLNQKAVYQG